MQNEKQVKHYQKIINILWMALACLAILGFLLVFSNHKEANSQHTYKDRISELKTKNSYLINANKQPHYVVNAQGHMDYNAQQTIAHIKKLFFRINNYKNGKQYAKNRQYAKTFVHSPAFFKGYEPSMIDNTGKKPVSEVDVSQIRKAPDYTDVYELSPEKYLVITHFYYYHNPADLKYEDDLLPTTQSFIFSGNQSVINYAQPLTKLSANNK